MQAAAVDAPTAPWPILEAHDAPPLAHDELRLLWLPVDESMVDPLPRRQRIDALLRRVLAPLCGVAADELRFGREAKGRPFLHQAGAPDFNLSDTTGGTLLAVTRAARVGVDLELHGRTPPALRLAKRYFDPREVAVLAALPAEAAAREFIALWTAKEASCKATGTGIFGFLPRWCFETGHAQPRLRALPAEAGEPGRWNFRRVAPSDLHTAVLALRDARPGLRVCGFRVSE